MSVTGHPSKQKATLTPGSDPRTAIRVLREQLLLHANLAAEENEHHKRAAIRKEPLPNLLQQLLQRYRHAHPDLVVEPVGWLSFDNQKKDGSPFDIDEWPDDDDLVILSHTDTLADTTHIDSRTYVLVAHRHRKG